MSEARTECALNGAWTRFGFPSHPSYLDAHPSLRPRSR